MSSTNGIFVNPLSGNVGIGTTIANNKLHVVGNSTFAGGLFPSSCNVYDLGSSNLRWRDLYLKGNTIDMDGTQISRDATTGGISIKSGTSGSNLDIVGNNVYATRNVGIGTTAPQASLHINSTGAIILPLGTEAEKPINPILGMIRYNSDMNRLQLYTTNGWYSMINSTNVIASGGNTEQIINGFKIHTFTSSGTFTVSKGGLIDYLIVAGGGAGAVQADSNNRSGGGGGAGGMIEGVFNISVGSYSVVVGGGGAGASGGYYTVGSSGNNSSIAGINTALGGGRGGAGTTNAGPSTGGCGGGGGAGATPSDGANGTISQGYGGGSSLGSAGINGASGGSGGGAGGPGLGWLSGLNVINRGGAGRFSNISGSNVVYGIGGDSGLSTYVSNPRINCGDGGPSCYAAASQTQGGGSGIVIIRYQV